MSIFYSNVDDVVKLRPSLKSNIKPLVIAEEAGKRRLACLHGLLSTVAPSPLLLCQRGMTLWWRHSVVTFVAPKRNFFQIQIYEVAPPLQRYAQAEWSYIITGAPVAQKPAQYSFERSRETPLFVTMVN